MGNYRYSTSNLQTPSVLSPLRQSPQQEADLEPDPAGEQPARGGQRAADHGAGLGGGKGK